MSAALAAGTSHLPTAPQGAARGSWLPILVLKERVVCSSHRAGRSCGSWAAPGAARLSLCFPAGSERVQQRQSLVTCAPLKRTPTRKPCPQVVGCIWSLEIAAAVPRELQFCPCSWLSGSCFGSRMWESPIMPAVKKEPGYFSLMNCTNCV